MSGITRRQVLKLSAAASAAAVAGASGVAARPTAPNVAVVGAGAFGGWTAWHLARQGARVTLIDAWAAGHERSSSGGETRVIRSLYGDGRIYVDWVRRSFTLWREAEQAFGVPLYRRTGALWMFPGDDAYARASLPHVRAGGLVAEEWTPAEAAARYPQISFDGVSSVVFEPEAGYLRAREACRAVAASLASGGADVRQAEARPGPIRAGGMDGLLLADGSRLQADAYVFACGAWLGRVFPELLGHAIAPTRQQIHYFGTPTGSATFGPEHCPVWVEFGERIVYGVPDGEGRGFKVADDTRGQAIDPTASDRVPRADEIDAARAFLAHRFPALAGAPLVGSRVCVYENSPDGNYLIDRHPGAGNVWIVGGGSGHGFKLGPALGEHVAGAVLGAHAPEPRFGLARLGSASSRHTQMESAPGPGAPPR